MRRILISCIIALTPSLSTVADDGQRRGPPQPDNGWSLFVGGGGFYAPTFSGDDEYAVSAVPFIRVTKGDVFFASVQEGAGYALINNKNGLRAGPLATIDFGRDEQGSSPFQITGGDNQDLVGLGNISTTVGLGGFAEYKFGDFKLKAKAVRAVSSHNGLTAELGVDFDKTITGFGPPLFVAVGPKINFADDNYNQAFYGITAQQSGASGLAEFQADSGILSYGVGGSLIMPLTYKTAITLFGSYDRLTGDAAGSPLIRERGSADQFFGGAAIAYKF